MTSKYYVIVYDLQTLIFFNNFFIHFKCFFKKFHDVHLIEFLCFIQRRINVISNKYCKIEINRDIIEN